jgi:hypothetical protein
MSKKRKKIGAWITYQFVDSPSLHDGYVSFAIMPVYDHTDDHTMTDTYGVPDVSIFYYTTDQEIKASLKLGIYEDDWKVVSIDSYVYAE